MSKRSAKKAPMKKGESIPEAFSVYLSDIGSIPPIARDEEPALILLAQAGDENAFRSIINSNLKFVVSIAKKYQSRGLDLDELVAEGNLGLFEAIKKFDPSRGVKFISYAVWGIKKQILDAIRKVPTVSRPREVILLGFRIGNMRESHYVDHGKYPSDAQIAERFEVTVAEVRFVMTGSTVSLDTPRSSTKGERGHNLHSFISQDSEDWDGEIDRSLQVRLVVDFVLSLEGESERNKKIFLERHGLGESGEAESFEKLGQYHSVSRECARQVADRIMNMLCSNFRGVETQRSVFK